MFGDYSLTELAVCGLTLYVTDRLMDPYLSEEIPGNNFLGLLKFALQAWAVLYADKAYKKGASIAAT
jgi:hypothetical protein